MKKLKSIVKEELILIVEDTRTFKPKNWNQHIKEKPFKENDRLRVYHGFRDFKDALFTAKYGLTGKERVGRSFSYENVNNPKGLFVSVDFDVVKKEFMNQTPSAMMEFNTLYKNLEAPVWHGGRSYFVQGEYTQGFSSEQEREEQMLKNRERASKSNRPEIAQSDRPELAETLLNNMEAQALFVGDLNPKEIKYFWVREDDHMNSPLIKYDRNAFLKKYWADQYVLSRTYDYGKKEYQYKKSDKQHKLENKFFSPNDDLDLNKWKNYILSDQYTSWVWENIQPILNNEKDDLGVEVIENNFYPKQIIQLKKIYHISDDVLNPS